MTYMSYNKIKYDMRVAYGGHDLQAEYLSELRNRLGKTQQEVANEAEISLRQYQRLEAGKSPVDKMAISAGLRLAKALNTTIEKIIAEGSN